MASSTERVRRWRERQRVIKLKEEAEERAKLPKPSKEEASSLLKQWAEALVVPSGLLGGTHFVIPDWQLDFIKASMGKGIREAGLSVARKNGKSGLIALLLLCHLVGPLRKPGWRGLVVSLTGRLALELWRAMEEICRRNDLPVEFRRTPQPGIARGVDNTRVDFLAADRASGHGSGADMAIIDEAGLIDEKNRDLWNAMMSSVSGRDGRLIAISIKGDGPMFREMQERVGLESVHWVEYAADPRLSLDDPVAWRQANPGLETGIKSLQYMKDMAARALASPNDQSAFAAYDLNLPQEPSRELILSVADWQKCVVKALPPKQGKCMLGIDLGGSTSMTCAAAYWPQSGRFEVWGAFPSVPDLRARGDADGVGGLYVRMMERGELSQYPGRVTDLPLFFDDIASRLGGETVLVAMDRYRKAEAITAMESAGVSWPVIWRGRGHSHTADGSADVRAFQKMCLSGRVKALRSLMLEAAIAGSSIKRDAAGNPKLDKSKDMARIDALQASVLALGLGSRHQSTNDRVYLGSV